MSRLVRLIGPAVVALVLASTTATAASETVTMSENVFWSFTTWSTVVTVDPGDTVTWVNRGNDVHNAIADDGSWRSPTLRRGETYSRTFTEPGEYAYTCTLHIVEGMTGKVIVRRPDSSAAPPLVRAAYLPLAAR